MSIKAAVIAVFVSTLLALAAADVYLHNPRGMNDRCDEESNDRDNEQRMYNSNDNAAGGYAWCDQEMIFYEGTSIKIEWTAQHSCGNGATNKGDVSNPESTICQQILQVGCDATFKMFAWGPWPQEFANYSIEHGQSLGRLCADSVALTFNPECVTDPMNTQSAFTTFGDTCTERRPLISTDCNGEVTNIAACNVDLSNSGTNPTSQGTGTFNSQTCQCSTRKMVTYGYHEPENWYLRCRARQGNGGLFTANQNPNRQGGATNTRQEPNSARYGYECTEERDYYPYFYPTPWVDLNIYTSQTENCSYYQSQSQNSNNRCECLASPSNNASWFPCLSGGPTTTCPEYYTTQKPCQDAGFIWTCYGSWNWAAPDCSLAWASTDNRLGNLHIQGDASAPSTSDLAYYNWNIPNGFVANLYTVTNAFFTQQGLPTTTATDTMRCTIRLRYNVSTAETLWQFDYLDNGRITTNPVKQYGIPINTSPSPSPSGAAVVDDTAQTVPVRMAVNTAQYGRTFQDRTYVFQVKQRSALPAIVPQSATIWNINVRGKRGNIAQVRNCLEYDYVPNNLNVNVGDWILFQWCGSDYNDQGNSGEGRNGLDRNNVVAVITDDYRRNYPLPVGNSTSAPPVFGLTDLLALAWIGQNPSQCYTTVQSTTSPGTTDAQNPMSCHYLNGPRQSGVPYMPTAYFLYFAQIVNTGTINFMNSRNNNFSNRSQKGVIIAGSSSNVAVIASAVVCSVVGAALIAGLAYGFYTKKISFGGRFSNRV